MSALEPRIAGLWQGGVSSWGFQPRVRILFLFLFLISGCAARLDFWADKMQVQAGRWVLDPRVGMHMHNRAVVSGRNKRRLVGSLFRPTSSVLWGFPLVDPPRRMAARVGMAAMVSG